MTLEASGTAELEEAVAAYREALKERTRERVPLRWATIQNNLGNALYDLGERASGTAKLEEAVVAYREALKERAHERVPLDWATSFGSEGVALMLLAERRRDAAVAKTALNQINTAFETLRDGGHAPNAAYFERVLPHARAVVARLRQEVSVSSRPVFERAIHVIGRCRSAHWCHSSPAHFKKMAANARTIQIIFL